MKNLTYILVFFLSVSFFSCSDDSSNEPAFVLSNANIAGNYDINNLSISTDITTTSNNISIPVATASTNGNLFKVDVVLNVNGTYTMKGSYTTVYELKPVVGDAVKTEDIIIIDNSGNYTINTTNNTITFSNALVNDLSGTLEVKVFNQTSFSLFQEKDVPIGNNIEKVTTNIGFTRK
jgi:hypothetical protein